MNARDSSNNILGSHTINLTSTTLTFLDTSSFTSLSGIAKYTLVTTGGVPEFAADDFTFAAAPEPSPLAAFIIAGTLLSGLTLQARRRTS